VTGDNAHSAAAPRRDPSVAYPAGLGPPDRDGQTLFADPGIDFA